MTGPRPLPPKTSPSRTDAVLAALAALALAGALAAGGAGCSRRRNVAAGPDAAPVPAMVPTDIAPGERRPLLLVLHGYGMTGDDMLAELPIDFERGPDGKH